FGEKLPSVMPFPSIGAQASPFVNAADQEDSTTCTAPK
ncbi:unnamed protein product, partial [marine sediment metagenome]